MSAGFELDLYTLDEHPLIFAFWNHIADAHAAHIERTEGVRHTDAKLRELRAFVEFELTLMNRDRRI